MGRGRAKAKQTKVARQLKYSSTELDVDALSTELGGTGAHDDDQVEEDPYDPYTAAFGESESQKR
jgi:hypothetical protein